MDKESRLQKFREENPEWYAFQETAANKLRAERRAERDAVKAVRDQKVIQGCNAGTKQSDIAHSLGVTRQRVQQIEKRLGLKRHGREVTFYDLVCAKCGKHFKTNNRNRTVQKRTLCTHKRLYEALRVVVSEEVLEERREKARKRAKDYYHTIIKNRPDFKEWMREKNKKYYSYKRKRKRI